MIDPPDPASRPAEESGQLDLFMTIAKVGRILTIRMSAVGLGLVLYTFGMICATPASAQKPAPVEDVSSFPPRSPQDEQKALHLPPGFEIQLVASEPDIQKPLNLAFDDRGRLWVTDTVEYPFPKPPGTPGRDSVKILSDFERDGRARKIQTFAGGLNIPIGLLPLPNARDAIVHNIPDIYLMRDANDDGRSDSREVLYGTFGHVDTHGMTNAFTWGFDGWIYACHGYTNDSRVQGSDHQMIAMNSGNTYRIRPDGTHAEYFTHGQVNPFGLAFDPLGNLYSCDCHSRPVYQLLRGAWYPSFGKPDDGLGFGPEMVTHDHGSTGIAGISYYSADQFPAEFRGTVFIGNVVTNRINRDRIEWHGSSPRGIEQPDFVWSEDNWFRPVDIELGPDGALYVADFYNRIIGHYEVPLLHPGRDRHRGRIWRIVYRAQPGAPAPPPSAVDRTRSPISELIADLGHPVLAVRQTAANQLVTRGGPEAIAAAQRTVSAKAQSPDRVQALWVLGRCCALEEPTLLGCARDADRALRTHALKTLIERRALTPALHKAALEGLNDSDPFVRRAAAEALGAHPDPQNIRPLLALRQGTSADDTHLLHASRIALRDQLTKAEAWSTLASAPLSERDARDIADVATGVHTSESAAYLVDHIKRFLEPQANLIRFAHHIARYGAGSSMDAVLGLARLEARAPVERLELLRAIQQGAQERGGSLDQAGRRFAAQLAGTLLRSSGTGEVMLGIDAVRDFGFRDMQGNLKNVVHRGDLSDQARAHAMGALAVIDPQANHATIAQVLSDDLAPLTMREWAAALLGNRARAEARTALLEALPIAPERLQKAIALALVRSRAGAGALLDAIAAGKASGRLLQDRGVTISLESSGLPGVANQIKALVSGLAPVDQRLEVLYARRRDGFKAAHAAPSEGASVFEKYCAICHLLGGKGARVGPQLDGVGVRGLERLMEDILDPNRNVDQSFRATNLALKNGQVLSGLLLREEGEVLVMADAQGKEIRIPKGSVEERSVSPLSPMPANLTDQISDADFYRLMEYLLSKRELAGPPASGKATR
jgi:putative heme-binding domain-containing protein